MKKYIVCPIIHHLDQDIKIILLLLTEQVIYIYIYIIYYKVVYIITFREKIKSSLVMNYSARMQIIFIISRTSHVDGS